MGKLRRRAENKSESRNFNEKLLDVDIDINIVNKTIYYILYYESVDNKILYKVKKFINQVNIERFINDDYKHFKYKVLIKLLDEYLERNSHSTDILEVVIKEIDKSDEKNLTVSLFEELAHPDNFLDEHKVDFIDRFFTKQLKYCALYKNLPDMENISEKLRSNNFEDIEELADVAANVTQTINKSLKDAKSNSKERELDFSLSNVGTFRKIQRYVKTELLKPANIIHTGIKMLNRMLNGGFQAGRVYLFIAPYGGGKSMLLLNVVKWFIECNRHIKKENNGLKPCILYMTQENDTIETSERLFDIAVPKDNSIRMGRDFTELTDDEVVDAYRSQGWTGDERDFYVMYRKNKTIDTSDLDAEIDILAEEGYEVKLIAHDYLKRINPVNRHFDLRLDLGEIIDEFSVIAKSRRIPIIEVMQLNRDAIRKINENQEKKSNMATKIGGEHIGESQIILENIDFAFIMLKEIQKATGKMFWTFKRIKSRGKVIEPTNYIAHPFEAGTEARLDEDYFENKSKSIVDLGDSIDEYKPNRKKDGKKVVLKEEDSSITGIDITQDF